METQPNATIEKIWQKLIEIEEKLNVVTESFEELVDVVSQENLDTRAEIAYTRDDVNFIKHNVLLVRQYQVNAKAETERLEKDVEFVKGELEQLAEISKA